METEEFHVQNGAAGNLRRLLALAVRSIQWSYSIFWSISSSKSGMLEWCDGYYNGDIKTRKTMQSVELNADQLGLHRSEQLRELYESLSSASATTTTTSTTTTTTAAESQRPSTALSPEDLTDTEWYFLVCMSFEFNIGQGLPGRSLSLNQTIWLCNAHHADSTTFLRSLLAKSASIQTVVCFPYLGGVVEFGVTELVQEDRNLIQHIKSSFLDNPCPDISIIPCYMPTNTTIFEEIGPKELDEDMMGIDFSPLEEYQDLRICSPINNANASEANKQENESSDVACINGVASQVEGWQFMEDDISNCLRSSTNTGDCTSRVHSVPIGVINPLTNEKRNQKDIEVFDCHSDDVHYQNVLSTVLKGSNELMLGPFFRKNNKGSSFVRWKKERLQVNQAPRRRVSQLMLKKVLFEVARMHGDWMLECEKDNNGKNESIWRPEADETEKNHARQEKLNERFIILGSLVPSSAKDDKLAILDDTIDYIKELERRIEDLESCRLEERTQVSHPAAERISGNYFRNKFSKSRLPLINKRKSREVGVSEPRIDEHSLGECSSDDLTVSVHDKSVMIAIKCPWKEYILNDIMEAVEDLNLEPHSVQSFNSDGNLSLTITSQFKASTFGSASMIRQALHRVIHKY